MEAPPPGSRSLNARALAQDGANLGLRLASKSLLCASIGVIYEAMTDAQETTLIEALKKVDAHGDIAPPYVQDPMTMALRQRAIAADLMRWDDSRGRYVLTGTGRSRISARNRASGAVLRFRRRDESEAPQRKAD